MTENEIKEATIKDAIYCAKAMACIEVCEECRFYGLCHTWCDDVYRLIVDALEEVQSYREIGTVEELQSKLEAYRELGTMEELKALKEKSEPKSRLLQEGRYYCPICGKIAEMGYCKACGQNLY